MSSLYYQSWDIEFGMTRKKWIVKLNRPCLNELRRALCFYVGFLPVMISKNCMKELRKANELNKKITVLIVEDDWENCVLANSPAGSALVREIRSVCRLESRSELTFFLRIFLKLLNRMWKKFHQNFSRSSYCRLFFS
jgi:hypothetical protein